MQSHRGGDMSRRSGLCRRGIPTAGPRGILFRSRLEAKYAFLFDILKLNWEYENVDLERYVPDFCIYAASLCKARVEEKDAESEQTSSSSRQPCSLLVEVKGQFEDDWQQSAEKLFATGTTACRCLLLGSRSPQWCPETQSALVQGQLLTPVHGAVDLTGFKYYSVLVGSNKAGNQTVENDDRMEGAAEHLLRSVGWHTCTNNNKVFIVDPDSLYWEANNHNIGIEWCKQCDSNTFAYTDRCVSDEQAAAKWKCVLCDTATRTSKDDTVKSIVAATKAVQLWPHICNKTQWKGSSGRVATQLRSTSGDSRVPVNEKLSDKTTQESVSSTEKPCSAMVFDNCDRDCFIVKVVPPSRFDSKGKQTMADK